MSASVKYSTKTSEETKKIVTTIIKDIDATLKKFKDSKNPFTTKCELFTVGHGLRPFGNNLPTDYIDLRIQICGKEYSGLGKRDAEIIGNTIASELRKKGCVVEMGDIYFKFGYFEPDMRFPKSVIAFPKPCKAFEKLNKYLVKNGINELKLQDLYKVNLFGKRGEYGESGEKTYLCYNEEYCTRILEDVKKIKSSKDKLKMSIKTIDDIDTDYSRRYETECYGYRHVMAEFVATTPSGRMKKAC